MFDKIIYLKNQFLTKPIFFLPKLSIFEKKSISDKTYHSLPKLSIFEKNQFLKKLIFIYQNYQFFTKISIF